MNVIKKIIFAIAMAFIITIVLEYINATSLPDTEALTETLSNKILRLHIIANSDNEDDQALKMEIKDAVVSYMQNYLKNSSSVSETSEIVLSHKTDILNICHDIAAKHNKDYDISLDITTSHFPIKAYGDIVLPSGDYNALKITLGKAEGKNWWCILYPPLCFVDASCGVVPDSSKEMLKGILDEDEYKLISESADVSFSFKYLKFLNFIFD